MKNLDGRVRLGLTFQHTNGIVPIAFAYTPAHSGAMRNSGDTELHSFSCTSKQVSTRVPRPQRLARARTRTAFRSALRSLRPTQTCACMVPQINEARSGGCGPLRILLSTIRSNRLGGRDPSICRQLCFQQNVSIHDVTCCSNGFPNLSHQRESCRAIASSRRGRLSKSVSRRFLHPLSSWRCLSWCCLCCQSCLFDCHCCQDCLFDSPLNERHFEQRAL